MKKPLFMMMLCTIGCLHQPAMAGDPKVSFSLGKGLTVVGGDSTVSFNMSLLMQNRLDVMKVFDRDFKPQTTAQVKRLRLTMKGFAFTPKLEYAVQLGFSPADIKTGIVFDAYLRYSPVKQFGIQFGQGKLPGEREEMTGDANVQFIDKTTASSLFKLERDFGIQLFGKVGNKVIFKPYAAMSTGEGKNFITASWQHFDYTVRMELLPLGEFTNKGDYMYGDIVREPKPKLAFAAAYDFNNKAGTTKGQLGGDAVNDTFKRNIQTIFADLIFKYKGLCIAGEYDNRFVKDNTVRYKYVTGQGVWASASYNFKKNYEPAFRYTRTFAGKKGNISTMNEYSVAFSKYFFGEALKIQTDYTLIDDKTIKRKAACGDYRCKL